MITSNSAASTTIQVYLGSIVLLSIGTYGQAAAGSVIVDLTAVGILNV